MFSFKTAVSSGKMGVTLLLDFRKNTYLFPYHNTFLRFKEKTLCSDKSFLYLCPQ